MIVIKITVDWNLKNKIIKCYIVNVIIIYTKIVNIIKKI